MWVTKLLISPVKKRVLCPKTTKFGPKLAFLVNLGQAMQAFSVPCWWVGWWLWRAGCISQDTYLLYILKLLPVDETQTSKLPCELGFSSDFFILTSDTGTIAATPLGSFERKGLAK